MEYLLKVIGILILIFGVICAVRPKTIRDIIEFAKVGKRAYIGGVLRLIIGALLLITVRSAEIPWIPAFIGALIIVSGVLVITLGMQRVHSILDWFQKLPDSRLRIPPVVAAIIGSLLIYAA